MASEPSSPYVAFLENPHQLEVIDQRKLPLSEVMVRLRTVDDVKNAIETMLIRGAPLIGIVGAYGMALAGETNDDLDTVKRELDATRPTAVNLAHATTRMLKFARESRENKARMFEEVRRIAFEEYYACKRMAAFGASVIPSTPKEGHEYVSVIHHCNTGGLATFGVGTALGVIAQRHKLKPNLFVWVDETRPRLQGAKLTAWELNRSSVPNRVIADGAAGSLLASNRVDCIIFGADRIAQNGDVVNKIGTYPLSVVGRENGVPVYCVAPTSTVDLTIASGSAVKIEERSDSEIFEIDGKRFVNADCKGYNPAFDVTPFKYITAIITEEMICYPPFKESLATAKARAIARQKGLAPHEAEAVVTSTIRTNAQVEPQKAPIPQPQRENTSKRSTQERLFPPQNDPVEERRTYHRDIKNRPAPRPKSFFSDGSEEPQPATKDPSTRAPSKPSIFGSEDDQPIVPTAAVRHYGSANKSKIVLGDSEAKVEQKPSIKVLGVDKNNKSVGLAWDDDSSLSKLKNRGSGTPDRSDIASITGSVEALDLSSGTSPVRSLAGDMDREASLIHSSKGHFEPPKREEREHTPIKAHIPPPVPEESVPQGKGHFPATHLKSNVFG